jgi:hypothetical protein
MPGRCEWWSSNFCLDLLPWACCAAAHSRKVSWIDIRRHKTSCKTTTVANDHQGVQQEIRPQQVFERNPFLLHIFKSQHHPHQNRDMGPPPTKDSKDNGGLFAPVEFVDLEERIGSEACSPNSVTLSITKPTIYREVLDPEPVSFIDQNLLVLRKPQRNECTVRVTTSFNLTVTITDFNRP